jgi:DNA-binding NarL/FixJ family response regulator
LFGGEHLLRGLTSALTFAAGGLLSRARLLLADDNAQLSAQIRSLLEPDFEVVGVVSSGEELETAAEALSPEVIVTDIAMPGEGGLVAARHIQAHHPDTRVVVLTVNDTSPMIRLARSLGVKVYVVKEDAADELVPAVRAALEGREYVSATGRRNLR